MRAPHESAERWTSHRARQRSCSLHDRSIGTDPRKREELPCTRVDGKLHGRVSWLAGTAVNDYQRARVYFTTPSLTVTQRRCWTHSFSFQSHPICMSGSFWARDSARSTRKNTAAQAQMQPPSLLLQASCLMVCQGFIVVQLTTPPARALPLLSY
jgi:hypothetical protein